MCAIEMYARLQLEMIGYLLFGFGFGFSDCLSSIQQCTIFFIYFFFLAIQRWFFSSSFSFIFRHLKHYIFGKWQHEWTYNSDTATTDSLIRLNDLIQNEVAFSILSMNCRAADAKKKLKYCVQFEEPKWNVWIEWVCMCVVGQLKSIFCLR